MIPGNCNQPVPDRTTSNVIVVVMKFQDPDASIGRQIVAPQSRSPIGMGSLFEDTLPWIGLERFRYIKHLGLEPSSTVQQS
jgi:hypothetical protein